MAPPARTYVRLKDEVAGQMLRWGIPWRFPCSDLIERAEKDNAGKLWEERCYKFRKPQHMQGLWFNQFEGSQFCAAPAQECPDPRHLPKSVGDWVWLRFRSAPAGADDTPPGGLYSLDFIGRSSSYPGEFGHMGMSKSEVIVDQLISIKLVKAPGPGQMTKELIDDYLKECREGKICMPNSEVPTTR